MFVGLAAFSASVSIATSIAWPDPRADARKIALGRRGLIAENMAVVFAAALGATLISTESPLFSTVSRIWVIAAGGMFFFALAGAGFAILQRRGIGLWQ